MEGNTALMFHQELERIANALEAQLEKQDQIITLNKELLVHWERDWDLKVKRDKQVAEAHEADMKQRELNQKLTTLDIKYLETKMETTVGT